MSELKEAREFVIPSGIFIKAIYGPDDIKDLNYERDLGDPGQFPYTRGPYNQMYRRQPFIMRQYTGFHSGDDTNERMKFLLKQGLTGLSLAFDLPTQMGLDSDHPLADGEVGRVGVPIDSLEDMEAVFAGIPLSKISTNMTINGVAAIMMAMYIATAEKQGVPRAVIRATTQNDILKEYVARGTWIFPPSPSIRLIGDTIEFAMKEAPNFRPLSVSPGHIHEAGAPAAFEAACGLEIAISYIEHMLSRQIDIDDFAPYITFGLNTHMNIFEEISKIRATRRLWSNILKDRYEAKNPKSYIFKLFSGGSGSQLTKQEPENNIIREAYIALATALAGCQAMGLICYDEAYTIPSEKSQLLTLRTMQILAHETGVLDTADPLGGSYFIEALTNDIENKIQEIMEQIEKEGGMVRAIETGFIQQEVLRYAYEEQRNIENGQKIIVGLNKFVSEDEDDENDIIFHEYDQNVQEKHREKLKRLRAERDNTQVEKILREIKDIAKGNENLMPCILEAVNAYCTVGEIVTALKSEFGTFREPTKIF